MPRLCPFCGYDVGAVLDAGQPRCPECGAELTRGVREFIPRPWWWYAAAIPTTILPAILIIAPLFLSRAPDAPIRRAAPLLAILGLAGSLPFLAFWTRWALRAHGLSPRDERARYFAWGLFVYNIFLSAVVWLLWGSGYRS